MNSNIVDRSTPSRFRRAVVPVLTGALAFGSFATTASAIDVTDVVAEIDAAVTPIGGIGGAVLLVLVAIAAFRWVRRAF